uniref:Uncharacterized protein n=1 Tax=Populus trichocarpa TaxID=3694 RepID=U5FQP7_POPTR
MKVYLPPESHANLAPTSDFITNLTTTILYPYPHPKHQTKQNKKSRIFKQIHNQILVNNFTSTPVLHQPP